MPTVTDEFLTAVLIRQQLVLHLLLRIGARMWLVLSPLGWAGSPQLRVLVAVFVAYDLVLAWAIRSGRLRRLSVRWVLDALDVTCWALLCPPGKPYTTAVVVAVPLVMVVTIRRRALAGTACGLGIAAVVCSARAVAHAEPYVLDVLIYLALAVLLGVLLPALLQAEARRQERRAAARAEADLVAAGLAGRNDVLTGVGADVIDELQTTIMRLTMAEVDAAAALRASVGAYKQTLGEQTRQGAIYLRDALDLYAKQVRAFEPRVARHIFFDLPGAGGTRVLSRDQASSLAGQLATAELAGVVPVTVLRAAAGQPVELRVGGLTVTLPAISRPRIRLSVAPVGTVCLALYALTLSNPAYTAVPLSRTVPLAAGIVAYALGGLLVIRRRGPAAEPWLAVAAFLPYLVIAAVTANTAGPPRLTLLGPLAGLAMLYGTVVAPPAAVFAARAGLLAATALAVWAAPALAGRYVAAELIWPLVAYLGAHLIARTVARSGSQLSSRLAESWREAAEARRRAAARQEVAYLLAVTAEGEQLCAAARAGEVRDAVRADLTRLRDKLTALRAELA